MKLLEASNTFLLATWLAVTWRYSNTLRFIFSSVKAFSWFFIDNLCKQSSWSLTSTIWWLTQWSWHSVNYFHISWTWFWCCHHLVVTEPLCTIIFSKQHLWCDYSSKMRLKSRSNSIFILLIDCRLHLQSYLLQQTPLKLVNWSKDTGSWRVVKIIGNKEIFCFVWLYLTICICKFWLSVLDHVTFILRWNKLISSQLNKWISKFSHFSKQFNSQAESTCYVGL